MVHLNTIETSIIIILEESMMSKKKNLKEPIIY